MPEPSTSALPRLFNTRQLAEYLGLSTQAIYTRHMRGQIPRAVQIGGSLRWRSDDIVAWLDEKVEAAR